MEKTAASQQTVLWAVNQAKQTTCCWGGGTRLFAGGVNVALPVAALREHSNVRAFGGQPRPAG